MRAGVLAFLALAGGFGAGTALWSRDGGSESRVVAEPLTTQSERPAAARPVTTPTASGSAGQKHGVAAKRHARRDRGTPRPSRTPRTGPRFRPPVLSWPRTPGAHFYWLQLYRVGLPGAEKILDTFVTAPRLALPASWTNARHRYRLSAGRYRWLVWPQFGTRANPSYTRSKYGGTFEIAKR